MPGIASNSVDPVSEDAVPPKKLPPKSKSLGYVQPLLKDAKFRRASAPAPTTGQQDPNTEPAFAMTVQELPEGAEPSAEPDAEPCAEPCACAEPGVDLGGRRSITKKSQDRKSQASKSQACKSQASKSQGNEQQQKKKKGGCPCCGSATDD